MVLGKSFRHSVAAALLIIASSGWTSCVWADDLKGTLSSLLAQHDRIRAAEEDLAAARERAKAALGVRYPTLSVTSHYGYEAQNKFESADTSMPSREIDLNLTQQLWDFGASSASIEAARLTFKQAHENLETAKQTLLLEGVSALLDVYLTQKKLDYAKQSVSNIKLQTELEDARVQEGSGYSADVLQAKSQLVDAEALRIKIKEELDVALNRHKTIFGEYPKKKKTSPKLKIPTQLLPISLGEAIKIAQENNPRLASSGFGLKLAAVTVAETKANELFPSVNLVSTTKHKVDAAGTKGYQAEYMVKVEVAYDFDFGLSSIRRLQATKHDRQATARRLRETRDQIEEQVKNKWKGLLTAHENAGLLITKTVIAQELLKHTREERDLGRRSLMDVLTRETKLINTLSEAVAAETKTVTKAYELLEVIGRLEVDWLE
jgi:TolC family type I secretion outer membrane protein